MTYETGTKYDGVKLSNIKGKSNPSLIYFGKNWFSMACNSVSVVILPTVDRGSNSCYSREKNKYNIRKSPFIFFHLIRGRYLSTRIPNVFF